MRSPSGHERRRHAFTLVEMLVAMAIIATVGVMVVVTMVSAGQHSAREGAREDVMDVLRQARMSAMDSGRGSLVRINAAEGAIYGLASTVRAAWHFETFDPVSGVTPGAKSMNGTLQNFVGSPVASGKVGLSFDFDGVDDYVDCGQYPVYDQTEGIRLEAWVNPSPPPPGVTAMGIIGKGNAADGMSYALGLAWYGAGVGYGVHAGLMIDPLAVPGPGVHLASYNPATGSGTTLPPNEWHHVAVEFDGSEGRLFVDGRLVDLDSYRFPEAAPPLPYTPNPVPDPNPGPPPGTDDGFSAPARIVPVRTAPLTIGSAYIDCPGITGTFPFEGLIDEPKVLSVAGGEPVHLPDSVPIVVGDPVVHFDSLGRLDTAYHGGSPIYIAVGDPYQTAKLAADISSGATTLTVSPTNPFPPTGGFVIVGPDAFGNYEVMQYDSVPAGSPTELDGLSGDFGRVIGASWDHYVADDERVFFARVIEVDQMGEVHRKTLPD